VYKHNSSISILHTHLQSLFQQMQRSWHFAMFQLQTGSCFAKDVPVQPIETLIGKHWSVNFKIAKRTEHKNMDAC